MCDDPRCQVPGTAVLIHADGSEGGLVEAVAGDDPLREALLRTLAILALSGEVGPGKDAQLMATGPDGERFRVLVVQEGP
jgi:hypothetical protein